MGLSSHSVEKFGLPFLMVDELVFIIPAGSAVNLTRHHFKFLFLLSGEICHEIDGTEGPRTLRQGDILAAPPVKFHRYVNTDPDREARIHAVRIFLDPAVLHSGVTSSLRKPESSFHDFVLHHFPAPVHVCAGIDPDIRAALYTLRKETETRAAGFRHRVHSLCTDLVILVARHLSEKSQTRSPVGAKGVVAVAMEYIQKHFTDAELRLGTIAFHVGKGDEHLSRQFKRQTGRSVFEFVREMRINYAKTLLLESSLSLTEIAGRCGFESLAFFSRSFKQLAGLPPSAYRSNLEVRLQSAPVPSRE